MGTAPQAPPRRLLFIWLATSLTLLITVVVLADALRKARDLADERTPVVTYVAKVMATPTPARTAVLPSTVAPATVAVTLAPATLAAATSAAATLAAATLAPTATSSPAPLSATATPTATSALSSPTPTQVVREGCWVAVSLLNLHDGPEASRRLVLRLQHDELVIPMARSADANWIQVTSFDGVQGWVARTGISCAHGELDALSVAASAEATQTPTRTPTATPPAITEWRGEYYGNTTLAGAPLLVRNDRVLSFDWGSGSPASQVPADNFSARWSRDLDFHAAVYRFRVRADDGVRLWVDGTLVLDEWHAGNTTYEQDVTIREGVHTVKLEYFELSGQAAAALDWNELGDYPDWRGEYYNNESLQGEPTIVRNDGAISFDWGSASPDPWLATDYFSVRWTREMDFAAGDYRFRLRTDDGVRFWLDGSLLLDEWHTGVNAYEREVNLTGGRHSLRLEYFEHSGQAVIILEMSRMDDYPDWKGEYYNNESLQGTPTAVRNDARIDFSWGEDAPASGIDDDHFSVRWTGRPTLSSGRYRFTVEADDGARLWVNGTRVINGWDGPSTRSAEVNIAHNGKQSITLEYRESGGWAEVHLSWVRLQPTPTATLHSK